jgi:hypothetical protein
MTGTTSGPAATLSRKVMRLGSIQSTVIGRPGENR